MLSGIAAIALIGILIFIHETGHFLVARLFGVRVLVYSLGFGRRIAGFRRGDTDYRISLLPLGGYVQMHGADPFMDGGEGEEILPDSFCSKPVWQRLLIVAAGPVFNLILPVVVFSLLYVAGQPQSISEIGSITMGTPAWESGLREGDRIRAIEGQQLEFWAEMVDILEGEGLGEEISLSVERAGETFPVTLRNELDPERPSPYDLGWSGTQPDHSVGIDSPASPAGLAGFVTGDRILSVGEVETLTWKEVHEALRASQGERVSLKVQGEDGSERELTLPTNPSWEAPELPVRDPRASAWGLYPASLMVEEVVEGDPASAAGVLPGDRMVSINQLALNSWGDVLRRVGSSYVERGEGDAEALPITMGVIREGAYFELEILPDFVRDTNALGRYEYRSRIGLGTGGGLVGIQRLPRPLPLTQAFPQAVKETGFIIEFTLEQVGKLLTGEAAPSKTLGGPVQIFRDAGAAAREGIFSWARMMAILSVSLGILNFLPIPVLDGGQFLFYLMEGIRGRPLPLRVREMALQLGVLFLVFVMLSVFVFDIERALTN